MDNLTEEQVAVLHKRIAKWAEKAKRDPAHHDGESVATEVLRPYLPKTFKRNWEAI